MNELFTEEIIGSCKKVQKQMPITRPEIIKQRREPLNRELGRNKAFIAQTAQTEKPFSKKVADLIKLTTSPHENKRHYAIEELGKLRDPRLAKLFLRLTADRNIYSSVSSQAVIALAKLGYSKTPIIANRVAKIVSRAGHKFSFYTLEQIYEGIANAKGGHIRNLFSIAETRLKYLPEDKRAVFKAAIALGKVPQEQVEPPKGTHFWDEESAKKGKIELLFYDWENAAKTYTNEQLIKRFNF